MAKVEVANAMGPVPVPPSLPLSSSNDTRSARKTQIRNAPIIQPSGHARSTNRGSHRQVTIAIVGAGQRGQTYSSYALKHPELATVVAIAEPRQIRRKGTARAHNVPDDMVFSDWKELLAKGRVADSIIISVMDDLHAELVAAFSKQHYHVLCEKPMATSIADCVQMVKDIKDSNVILGVGHVLRYSPYNRAIKDVIDSGALGEIVNIQHIEPVGDTHFSHSFVRGNWRREDETSFALMTKCCHDIDILSYYLSGRTPKRVSSFGSLFHFKPEQKPAEAGNAKRCLDCAYELKCTWSAKKTYIDPFATTDGYRHWAELAVDADPLDIETVTEAMKTSPYGKCVYETDNDVVDHQVVNIEYEGGVTANMTMSAFTEAECDRGTKIHGTKGELVGDMVTFTVFDFLTRSKTLHNPTNAGGGHGGGDEGLAGAFCHAVAEEQQDILRVTPDEILNSHLLVFAGEKARLEGSVVDFAHFKADAVSGKTIHKAAQKM